MNRTVAQTIGESSPAAIRELVTPEGVPLRLAVAGGGARVAAFFLDLTFIALLTLAIWILVGLLLAGGASEWIAAPATVATFLLRNFYMSFFEIRSGGATPGKRLSGLRVVDRRGGALTAEAVFARNLTREIEFWIPLMLILAPSAVWPGAPLWASLCSLVWVIAFAVVPWLNQDRLRFGDLIAGTMVVEIPKAALLGDLSANPSGARRSAGADGSGVEFTQAQLDVYGIYELQVLEELLRGKDGNRETLELVADKIKRKIGWDDRTAPRVPTMTFLRAFYDAQRGRLEGKLLMGERKERKGTGRRTRRKRDR